MVFVDFNKSALQEEDLPGRSICLARYCSFPQLPRKTITEQGAWRTIWAALEPIK